MLKDLRFCIIGRGSIGTRHIRNLKKMGFNNIIAFTESKDQVKDKIYCQRYQVRSVHYEKEVAVYKPDVFIIANPTASHIESAMMALDLGGHVFMEKPLSHNLKGVYEFRNNLKSLEKKFMLGNNLRFHPVIAEIKRMIDNGCFGDIYFVSVHTGQFLPDWHPKEDYRKNYAAKESLGGGCVLTLQHEIDYIYWFLGRFGNLKSFTKKVSSLEVDTEDIASIIIEAELGPIVEIHLDYLQRPPERRVHIQGSKGSVKYSFNNNSLIFYDFESRKYSKVLDLKDYDYNQMYLDEIKHFLDCILNNKKPLISFDEAVYTLDICMRIKREK